MSNKTLWQYYVDAAAAITDHALEEITTLNQWESERARRREEFFSSMGLHAIPRCELAVTPCGEFRGPGYRVLRLAYQILPDAWGTGNLYLPDPLPAGPAPAVLNACGHTASGVGDYFALAAPWARRGYACFVFDTIAQTDNPGYHRGLNSGRRLDLISRGYTSAGGELLNGLRALEVLRGRPEIDPARIGVTGRSGGGAQSFYLAVADEGLRAAVPVVGVASLKSTIGNRIFPDHCDCMYAMGLYQRDNADFAALIAPRPLLLCFARGDSLYSQDEYRTLAEKAHRIYRLYGCEEHCQLLEYPGGHGESEPPTTGAYHWFDQHVAGKAHHIDPLEPGNSIEPLATVFNGARPVPDRVDLLPELLTITASRPLPHSADEWPAIRDEAIDRLKRGVFGWLDRNDDTLHMAHRDHGWHRGEIGGMESWLHAPDPPAGAQHQVLAVCDVEQDTRRLLSELQLHFPGEAIAAFEPRATGFNAPVLTSAGRTLYRAGGLLGLTPVLLWLQDLRTVIPYLRGLPGFGTLPLYLYGHGDAAVACLYHAILHDEVAGAFLVAPPASHLDGGYLPAILREMDITSAVGLLAPRPVGIVCRERMSEWYSLRWGHRVYHRLGIPDQHALGGSVDDIKAAVLTPPQTGAAFAGS